MTLSGRVGWVGLVSRVGGAGKTGGTGRSRLIVSAIGLVVLLGVLAAASDANAQCAMCRTMLATPEGQKMVAALRSGILLLLAAPFTIFGAIAMLAVRAQRRRQAHDSVVGLPAQPAAPAMPANEDRPR